MRTNILFFLFLYTIRALGQDNFQLVIPTGHTKAVQEISISDDEKLLASIAFEPDIFIWDVETKQIISRLKAHNDRISSIKFHDDKIISLGMDGLLIFWNLNSWSVASTYQHENSWAGMEIGEEIYAFDTKGGIYKFDLGTGALLDSLVTGLNITSIFINDDRLFAGTKNGTIQVVELNNLQLDDPVNISEFQINKMIQYKGQVIVALQNGEISILGPNLEEVNRIKAMDLRVYDLAISGDTLYCSGRDNEQPIKIFDLNDLNQIEIPIDYGANTTEQLKLGVRDISLQKNGKLAYSLPNGSIGYINHETKETEFLKGYAKPILKSKINGDQLFVLAEGEEISMTDLSGKNPQKLISPFGKDIQSFDVNEAGNLLVAKKEDKLLIYDLVSQTIKKEYEYKSDYPNFDISFDPGGKYVILKKESSSIELLDIENGKSIKVKADFSFNYDFNVFGDKFFVQYNKGLKILNAPKFKKGIDISNAEILDFTLSENKIYILKKDKNTIAVYDFNGKQLDQFSIAGLNSDKIFISDKEERLFGTKVSIDSKDASRNFPIKIVDLSNKELSGNLVGHDSFVRNIKSFKNDNYYFSSSSDGSLNIYDKDSQFEYLGKIIPMSEVGFVVITPNGNYDATPKAMETLNFIKKWKRYNIQQFKSSFYEPNLLPRLLGYIDNPIPNKNFNEIPDHPEMKIQHPNLNDGLLGVTLSDKGGGVGRVVIIINGKEINRNAREVPSESGTVEFNYQIAGHPYLLGDKINTVTIKAYNVDGTLSTPEKNIFVFPDNVTDKKVEPKLYALVVGSSDYEGEELDLNYAAKDANDFAEALKISAFNQFGKENVNLTVLTTENMKSQWPFKNKIDSVFSAYGKEANANDYLLVYMSGHGLNEEDFYYMTPEASSQEISDETLSASISSIELTEMINRVAALNQILILDACHSGRFANELMQFEGTKPMDANQIKALEKMKDRTGLYVLAGSKADAVSYEASIYEQGLLTYSILFGMKGAALGPDREVDIMDLFQFVYEKVPELAGDIGGIQKPELRYPNNATSFTIGKLSEEDTRKIDIVEAKPILIQSSIQEESNLSDPLSISSKIDKALREMSDRDRKFVFVDKNEFSGSYRIWGRYKYEDDQIKMQIKLYKGNVIISSFQKNGYSSKAIIDEILIKLVNYIN